MNGNNIFTFEEYHNKEVVSLAFNYDSTVLASGSMDSTICLWDVEEGILRE